MIIFFDWYGVTNSNPESFGQITFCNAEFMEKLGVINLDLEYEDLFKLIFELFKKHADDDIVVEYERVM